MSDRNKPVEVKVVLGLNNGVLYFKNGGLPWDSDIGGDCSWVETHLASRPEDWAVLVDTTVFVSDRA